MDAIGKHEWTVEQERQLLEDEQTLRMNATKVLQI